MPDPSGPMIVNEAGPPSPLATEQGRLRAILEALQAITQELAKEQKHGR
jgi:hypothetical protein